MGLDIDKEYIKAKQTIADYMRGNKDGSLQAGEKEAIELFKNTIVNDYERGKISNETFNHAMGLYVTNPTQEIKTTTDTESVVAKDKVDTEENTEATDKTTEATDKTVDKDVAETTEATDETVDKDVAETTEATAKEQAQTTEISNDRKKAINATCDRYLDELYEEGVSRKDLLDKFDEKVGAQKDHPEYKAYRKAIEEVLTAVNAQEYETLADISKKSSDVKKDLKNKKLNDQLHRDILKDINNILDNEIRIKALEEVEKYYNEAVANDKKAGKKRNNAEIMKEIRNKLYAEKKFTGDEYRMRDTEGNAYIYAFCHFRNTDIMEDEVANLNKAIAAQNSEDQTNWHDVSSGAKEDLKEEGLYSYLTKRAGNQNVGPEGDEERRIKRTSKNQARSNNVAAHNFQTEEEILATLGNKSTVYEALLSKELITKTENGEYDLTKLQDALKEPIGFDNNWNKHIKGNEALSERLNAITKMAHETGLSSLTEEEVTKLVELCGFGIEKTGWNWGKAIVGAILGGVTAGLGAATGLATTPVKDGKDALNLKLKVATEGNISIDTSKLPPDIASAIVQNGNEVLINLTKVKPGADALQILMTMIGPVALKSAALGAALGLLNGIEKGGEISVASTSFGEKDYGKYIEKIKDRYPEYAGILEGIALNFVDKEGKWDYEGYYNFLDEMAGRDSVLNWDELDGGLKALEAKLGPEDTGNKDDVVTKKVYVANKAAVEEEGYNEAIYEDVPTTDGSKSSWPLITEMYGECLKTKFPSLSDRIRVLKLTQAITDGNYSEDRLRELLALSRKGLSAMRNVEGIDFDVYEKVLNDGIIGTIKAPKELAGCKKCKEKPDNASFTKEERTGTGTGAYAKDKVKIGDKWVQTKAGSNAVYALRVEGETEVRVFTGPGERDTEFAKIKNENPSVTIEKVEVEYSKIKEDQIQQ